jgi:hypothetical protein
MNRPTLLLASLALAACTSNLDRKLGVGHVAAPLTSSLPAPLRRVTADFDGDGRSDLLIVNPSGTYEYLSTGDGFVPNVMVRNDWQLGQVELVAGDFDGDGGTDLLVVGPNGASEYMSTLDGQFQPDVWVRSDWVKGSVQFFPGDFDGNGTTDLMVVTQSGSDVFIAKGDGQFKTNVFHNSALTLGNVAFFPGDYNGDGKTDMLARTATGSTMYFATGGGKLKAGWSRSEWVTGQVDFAPINYDADDFFDLLVTTASGTSVYQGHANGVFTPDVSFWVPWKLGFEFHPLPRHEGSGGDYLVVVGIGEAYNCSLRYEDEGLPGPCFKLPGGPGSDYYAADFNGLGSGDVLVATPNGSFAYHGMGTNVKMFWSRADLTNANTSYF